jgi:hypothetical protein
VTLPLRGTASDVLKFDRFTGQIVANCSKTGCCLSFSLMAGSNKNTIHNRTLEMGQRQMYYVFVFVFGNGFFVTLQYRNTISDVMEFDQVACQITVNCSKTSCCLSCNLMTGSNKKNS